MCSRGACARRQDHVGTTRSASSIPVWGAAERELFKALHFGLDYRFHTTQSSTWTTPSLRLSSPGDFTLGCGVSRVSVRVRQACAQQACETGLDCHFKQLHFVPPSPIVTIT